MLAETVTARTSITTTGLAECILQVGTVIPIHRDWVLHRSRLQAILRMMLHTLSSTTPATSSRWPWLPEQAIAKLQFQCHTALKQAIDMTERVFLANYVVRFDAYVAFMLRRRW